MYRLDDIAVRHGPREVLRIDRLKITGDAFTVILGHNGSGKSTLMGLLARQHRSGQGDIRLDGTALAAYSQRRLARRVAFLPQRLPEVPGLTVRELVRLGRFPWRGALGRWRTEDEAAVADALDCTGVAPFAETLVDHLSGGERQRAWIAMLLAQGSPLLLLDEPTSALDVAHQVEVLALLRRLNRQRGLGVVVILHDVNLAARHADRVIALKGGRIVFDGAPGALMQRDVLSALYGVDISLVPHPARAEPVAVIA